jgi:ribonuclease III, bacterial
MAFRGFIAHCFTRDKELARYIKNVFGFYPRNIFLFQLAFKHKSVSEESIGTFRLSNERLEYLGDTVLSTIVADYLFKKFPIKSEGFLTEMRSRIVSRNSLNKLSQKLGFDDMIQYSRDGHTKFRCVGGDAFEAFVGAIFLDRGFNFTRKIIINRIINVHIDIDQLEQTEANFKSKLLEWAQKQKKHIEFKVLGEKGEGYNKLYIVQVNIDGKDYGQATDYSIKGAEQLAAEKTWTLMQEGNKNESTSDKAK